MLFQQKVTSSTSRVCCRGKHVSGETNALFMSAGETLDVENHLCETSDTSTAGHIDAAAHTSMRATPQCLYRRLHPIVVARTQ
jgi:hypothetical protein